MKGYVDYLCVLDAEIQREFERGLLDVEVPYMAEKYKAWMVTNDGKTKNVANSYMSYIKKVDKEFFLFNEDFFYLLPKKVKVGDLEGVSSLFDKYLEIIEEWFELAKKENYGYTPKEISDWRSGFRNYRRFIEEWLLPVISGHKTNLSDMERTTSYKRLFAEDDFLLWLTTTDEKGTSSAQSYISRIKRLNSIISKTASDTFQKYQGDIFGLIPRWLKEQKGSDVVKLLTGIEEKLVQQIHTNDTHLLPIPALRNSVSALRRYTKFILEEYIEDIDDSDELPAEAVATVKQIGSSGEITVYDYPMLERNFKLRLMTQDRMSNGKDVFFPIGVIKRLFRLSEKTPIDGFVCKGEYKWFNMWIDNCIAEIKVMTDKGTFIMAELSEYDTFIINTTTKEVTVTLQDGETAKMLTPTEDDTASPRFMEVDRLSNIHIDHTPLISKLLSENISALPAMVRLTEIMRKVAETNNLSFNASNFSAIENKVINSNADVVEMLKMLPMIKDELELVRSKSTLCLMAAKCNLKKK